MMKARNSRRVWLGLIAVTLVVCMMFAGCAPQAAETPSSETSVQVSEQTSEEPSTDTQTPDKLTIAFSLKTITNDDFQKSIADSIQSAVEASGNEFMLVTAGDQTAVANQVKQLEDLIAKGVDGIVLNPMDGKAVVPVLEKAKEAGIPVVIVDSSVEEGNEDLFVTYIGTDNFNAGVEGGKALAEALGNTGNVLIVRGANGSSAGDQRVDGFKKGIEDSGLTIAGEQPGDWKNDTAMQVTENMLQANPDVQGIFSASDVMLDGILQALSNNDKSGVQIMAVDGSMKAVELIESGEVMGTMAQFPQNMGSKAVEILLGILDGSIDESSIEKFIDSGTMAYTKDNLDEAKKWAF